MTHPDRPCLIRLLAMVLVGLLATPAGAADPPTRRPNVLLILADDLGYSDVGCYGGEIATPNLDALAAGGVRFTRFANGSRCCPSRASLLTGLYPTQAGIGEMTGDAGEKFPGYRGHLVDRCATIPEVLKSAGYRSLMVGKWHLGANPGPIVRGFDEFYGMIGGFNTFWEEKPHYSRRPAGRKPREYAPGSFYSTDVFADYALDFLQGSRADHRDQPWFLYLAFNAPHFPLHAPEADIAKYEALYARGWDAIRADRLDRMKRLGIVPPDTPLTPRSLIPKNQYNTRTGWADKENPAWDSLPEDRRRDLARRMAVYAAMVDRMDRAIGRVVADLKQAGEFDDTLILFLSDNGACAEWDPYGFDGSSGPTNTLHATPESLAEAGGPRSYISYGSGWANASNTPFRLYKHYGHEGGISTPLIAHWPARIKQVGALRTQPGHLIDVMATIVDATGATYPAERAGHPIPPMEGKTLLPAAIADQPIDRDLLAWEHEGNRAIRRGQWKLVALRGRPWELYDIDADRLELHDLATGHPDLVKDLAARWDEWARRTLALPHP